MSRHTSRHALDSIGNDREPLIAVHAQVLTKSGRVMPVGSIGMYGRTTRPDRHLLIIGPPQSGKTSTLLIPIVLSAPGPVVSTSTHLDVFNATSLCRSMLTSPATHLWVYDPTGTEGTPPGALQLRWSPVTNAKDFGRALRIAKAMAGAGPRTDVSDSSFWYERAETLLATLLHAAALQKMSMRQLMVQWIFPHDGRAALDILAEHHSEIARSMLAGVLEYHDKMLGSIWASVANLLSAYRSDAALNACERPNFDSAAFVRSSAANALFQRPDGTQLVPNLQGTLRAASTLYIIARGEDQEMVAPLVAALLTEIRDAAQLQYRERQRNGIPEFAPPVVFALDELAHIAPLKDLPATLAEGGGRGVLVAGALQDLSQAFEVWGEQAAGFLTLFGDIVILPGISHRETLELLQLLGGEYDRWEESVSEQEGLSYPMWPVPWATLGKTQKNKTISSTWSMHRQHVVPADELFRGPSNGDAYLLQGGWFFPLCLTPYYSTSPWPQLLVRCMELAGARLARGEARWWNWDPPYRPYELLPTPPLPFSVLRDLGLLNRWNKALVNRREH